MASNKVKKHKIKKKAGETEKVSPDENLVVIPVSKILIGLVALIVVGALIFLGINMGSGSDTQSNVAAVVNGEKIMWSEINERYNSLNPQVQAQISKDAILNQTINEKLLLQEAEKRNIEADQETLSVLVERVRNQFGEEEFERQLQLQGLTIIDFRDQLADTLKINQLLANEIPSLRVNESEAEEFYEENKDDLGTPEQVRASHILLNTSEEAEEALELLEQGEEFEEIAENYSIGPSASQGGDLGYFSRGMLVPEFEEVAFNMSVGNVSGIVETDFGYHIIKVTGRREATEPTFEELEPLIEFNLFDQKYSENQEQVNQFIKDLRQSAEIEK